MQTTRPSSPSRLSRTAVAVAWLVAAGGTIAVLLIAAAAAEGGTYHVAQCDPRRDAARGDLLFDRNSGHYVSVSACLEGNGLVVRHDARRTPRDRWGEWSLEAPEGTDLQGIRARVSGTSAAGHAPELFVEVPGADPTPFGRATGPLHAVRWTGEGADGFSARLRCARASCGEGAAAKLVLRRIAVRLFDSVAPQVEPAGPLAAPHTHRGSQLFRPLATDVGSGVRRVFLQINGEPVAGRRVGCQLRDQIAIRLKPCPASAEPSFTLNTASGPFRQGPNRLRVCALDLGTRNDRNRDCASRQVRVDNDCPVDDAPAGTIEARITSAGRADTVAHGEPAGVAGRLVDASGHGIGRAKVCVGTRVDIGGASERVVATPTTDGDGRFEAHLDPGASREVRIAHWGGTERVAERYLRLRVRARPGFTVRPKRALHNGQRVHFRVRLHGPEPAGRRFHVKVRTPSGWHRLRSETTDRSGAWSGSYRFHSTTGQRTYPFRVLVPSQQGYPFVDGWSRTRKVRVEG